ncbi:hypothetical protein BT63DRAFT_428020 [Microthyrium microscopicum]|uniref:Uncharacterized protein n=1 Tax=Microthyrium microscopicum TaxID=703497 RepID=A0A6A6U292_9PEZI|nr:hypothetical protein BT63DRAFT_428020 [Microthyrium microscopicum]
MTEKYRMRWMQRVALIRHNLHSAIRTNDFSYFKVLQAHMFTEGLDYVAELSTLHNDADAILRALDDLNVGLAFVSQDAFKTIYDNIRSSAGDDDGTRRAMLRVDVSQQKQITDFGVDKVVSSTTSLIENQPECVQDLVASVWIYGVTIVADAIQTSLIHMTMNELDDVLNDFIQLEYRWQTIQTAVEASVGALRGVLNFMSSSGSTNNSNTNDNASISSENGRRNSSIGSAGSWMRRFSTALSTHAMTGPPPTARNSIAQASPRDFSDSLSAACPTTIPNRKSIGRTLLEPIPHTPYIIEDDFGHETNAFEHSFAQ